MNDVFVSEFWKIRSVRSTYLLLGAIAAIVALGVVVDLAMTIEWDGSTPERRAKFGSAEASQLVIPFTQFCLGVLGVLAVTTEHGTGMIRTSLVAVPRRRTMLAAKVAVVVAGSLVLGMVIAFGTFFASLLIAGDRPPPIWPWASVSDALPSVLSNGLSVMIAGIVGLGLGLVIRSSAGALVTLSGLLFVLPVVALLLPAPWDDRLEAVMLPSLPWQLANASNEQVLSPLGAAIAMAVYVIVAIGAGGVSLVRRDP